MKNISFLLFIVFALAGCTEEILIQQPPYQKKLALMSASNDTATVIRIYQSRTYGAFERIDNNSQTVDTSAEIRLFKNNTLIARLWANPYLSSFNRGPNQYFAELPPNTFVPGETFTIQGTKTGFPTATANATVPSNINITDALIRRGIAPSQSGGSAKDGVEITFQDPAGVENFYMLRFVNINSSWSGNSYLSLAPTSGRFGTVVDANGSFLVFSDRDFDGQLTKYLAVINTYNYSGSGSVDYSQSKIVLYHISKEKYSYMIALGAQNSGGQGNPFIEPASITTNVTNGEGLFAIDNVKFFPVRQ